MRILVTGAGGFLGRHLVRALESTSHEVTGLDLFTGTPGDFACRPICCDLTDAGATRSALRGLQFDTVIHLASASRISPEDITRKVAAEGTRNLLDSLRHGFDSFILAGSSAVYGRVPAGELPAVESRRPEPAGFYGACHLEREDLVTEILSASGAGICIFRMFNLVGPGQAPVMLVPQVARRLALAAAGRPEGPLFGGSLEPRRDYVDVRDVAEAYLAAISRNLPGLNTINLCSGVSVSGRDVVRALCGLFGEPFPADGADGRKPSPNDVMDLTGDGSAALGLLGWRPSTALSRSLADVAEEWRGLVSSGRT